MNSPTNINDYRVEREYKNILQHKDVTIKREQQTDQKGMKIMDKHVTKETFEQYEKRIDSKIDALPERLGDKIDAKISNLEARQTKWFVGIMTGLLGVLLKAFGVI
ncbi:glycyl-tRNA synthetase alpha subunit [Staphylococcus auricularis]|uniref:hypothetical protein n=1 Tax=Staphylococcus auricularis TaxID=29379 RepID=UPI001EED64F1|nr:hypothetical protein [Staphylococcus auricularis]MCG7342340.1 hypothetical protein [Staphylococcus auricularis]